MGVEPTWTGLQPAAWPSGPGVVSPRFRRTVDRCPRRESNPAFDLRKVACHPPHLEDSPRSSPGRRGPAATGSPESSKKPAARPYSLGGGPVRLAGYGVRDASKPAVEGGGAMLPRWSYRRTGSALAALILAVAAVGCEADPSMTPKAAFGVASVDESTSMLMSVAGVRQATSPPEADEVVQGDGHGGPQDHLQRPDRPRDRGPVRPRVEADGPDRDGEGLCRRLGPHGQGGREPARVVEGPRAGRGLRRLRQGGQPASASWSASRPTRRT